MNQSQHEISTFLEKWESSDAVLIDVRSTSEYKKAHISGALSLPLLDDEHRAVIGTIYKQKGREAAVMAGFELVGPLFHEKIKQALVLCPRKEVFIYCWRGGMRSNIMAWMLQLSGFKVHLLKDGYKSFRHFAIDILNKPLNLQILGGKTGAGKTEMLHLIKASGEQVIDLENLAGHKGSSFGQLGLGDQPSQEHFENILALQIRAFDKSKIIWMENESRAIGKIKIPNFLFDSIRIAPVIDMIVDDSVRKQRILNEYGHFSTEELSEKTKQIAKRLGGQHIKAALDFLEERNLSEWLEIVLRYYDKTYLHCNEMRPPGFITEVNVDWRNPFDSAKRIMQSAQ